MWQGGTTWNDAACDGQKPYICGYAGSVDTFQERVCEGSALTLDCGAGTINIQDASYGRQHGPDVCPHAATSNQECHELTSTDIVSAACQGESTCTIQATNGVFGDPCGGTYKYLTVNYDCAGSLTNVAAGLATGGCAFD